MKVFWRTELNGRGGLVAEPEGYDGTPWLRELWLDRAPLALHPDRVAIAAALVFGSDVAGDLEFESPISIGVAEAIKHFCKRETLNISPVNYEQRPFAFGDGRMRVITGPTAEAEFQQVLGDRSVGIHVLRSDKFSGSLLSPDGFFISSNAYLHDAVSMKHSKAKYGSLAVGVLFSEDLGLDVCLTDDPLSFEANELLIAGGLRTQ